MFRRPPRSTLFPSPPLSRSPPVPPRSFPTRGRMTLASASLMALYALPRIIIEDRCAPDIPERIMRELEPYLERTAADRKSTRLNSSHLVISYAVFCLKKKHI